MNRQEFEKFCESLFTAFPSYREHLNSKASDPIATRDSWLVPLSDVELSEANDILRDWQLGNEPFPQSYERDHVAALIRSKVMFRRSKANHHRREFEAREQSRQEVMQRRTAYENSHNRVSKSVYLAFCRSREAWEKVEAGTMTRGEYDAICSEILMEFKQ